MTLIKVLLVIALLGGSVIKFICPKCGSEVQVTMNMTNPPQMVYSCRNEQCGYKKIQSDKIREVIAPE